MTIAFLIVLIAAVIGSVGMVSVFAWIFQRVGRLEGGAPGDLERIASENADLREQIEAMRSELHALDERVDFAEKLLEGSKPDALPAPDSTPES